jgi:hypothetical protein
LKFDVSTILLVIVAVIPGLFAQRTRNQLVPRSFAPQGASAELAELVALGVSTHGILVFLSATILLLVGWLRKGNSDYFFSKFDSLIAGQWCSQHIVEASLIASGYVFVSFFFSHWLGFIYGVWRSNSPFTTKLLANATWLRKWFGVTGLLGERPIIYEVLNPALDHGTTKSVFVEIEMKEGLGFYSGQLSQFAIVKDDEPHKPIFLIDVWFKKERSDDYESVETDGIMIDLADAATLLVKQVDVSDPTIAPPTREEIASLAHKFWTDSGCKDGTAEQDWLRAEQQLRDNRHA